MKLSKWAMSLALLASFTTFGAKSLLAKNADNGEKKRLNQVIFRGAYSHLSDSRGGELFTDTGAASGTNNGKGGFLVGAGLNLALTDENALFNNVTLLGEVMLDYSRFSKKAVVQTASYLAAGGTPMSKVDVSLLNVSVNPKIRIDSLGRFRPYVVPVGLAFLVNSPPSNDATYLDVGLNFAGGLDIKIIDQVSAGIDVRYTHSLNLSDTHNSYLSAGGYVGINF